MLPVAKRGKATGAPGEAFAYSNFGYVLLGEISERASGRDLGDLIRERILAPLAASDTVYNVKHPIAPSIHGYGTNFRPWSDTWVYWEHSGPDAGVMAPAEDVLRFIDALTSEDGAFAEIGDRMFEATVESGPRQRQGLGLHARTTSSGVELVGHSGDVFGYLSFVYARSDRDAVVFGHVNCDCEDLLVSMIGNVLRAEEAIDP
ncbi:MAG: serine hydrolase domain-containing protein, partial [Pseudomonadota bacterium]